MNKTLFTAVLALVLAIGGVVASSQAQDKELIPTGRFTAKSLELIGDKIDVNLSANLVNVPAPATEGKTFGYLLAGENDTNTFVSLGNAVKEVQLPSNQVIRFGYATNASDFEPRAVSLNVSSDPGYYASYDANSFYQLDFSEKPFDGTIDIYVFGEPLPSPVVTMIVALAAGALFLLYKNRKQRSVQTEQA